MPTPKGRGRAHTPQREPHPPGGIWLEPLFLSSCHEPPGSQTPLLQDTGAGSRSELTGKGWGGGRVQEEALPHLPPLAYSMTRYRVFSVSITSNNLTTKEKAKSQVREVAGATL